MKKKILMLITAALMTVGVAAVAPKVEVEAATFGSMSYDETVSYWVNSDNFNAIYAAEKDKSDYADVIKQNKVEYFKASMSDFANRPGNLQASRPLTYNFMRDAIALSNPNLINFLKGNYCNTSDLWSTVKSEINARYYWLSDDERKSITSNIVSRLNGENVYSVSNYDSWKSARGGRIAADVYGYCYKAPACYTYDPWYGWYGCYGWNAKYYEYVKAQEKLAAEKAAYEAAQQAKANAYNAALAGQYAQAQAQAEAQAQAQDWINQAQADAYNAAISAQNAQAQAQAEAQAQAQDQADQMTAQAYQWAVNAAMNAQ